MNWYQTTSMMAMIPHLPNHPSHSVRSPTCRDGFKPLPTTEPASLETPERDMEEGMVLEMTPLTQATSFNDDDDEQLSVLLEGGLDRPSSPRHTTNVVGDGDSKGIAPIGAGGTGAASASGGGFGLKSTSSRATSSERGGALLTNEPEMFIDDHAHGHRQGERGNHTIGGHGNNNQNNDDGRAASGRSPCSAGRGTLGLLRSDNEHHENNGVRRGRGGLTGDLEKETNRREDFDEDRHVVERRVEENPTTRSAVWREFLVPIKMLQEKRVRAILFVYVLYSVRSFLCFQGAIASVKAQHFFGDLQELCS